ncbi:hypothetical protein BGZ54_009487 [Gamsiella multidivaricata]|nr:hypothetical protein BGZ54_009487 [Gamsiella multidivaricata]
MSSSSSCASSPFSSPETGAEIDLLDMPMFFPSEQSLQPILDLGAPNDLLMQQHPYQSCASVQQPKHPQQFQFSGLAHIGLGTPPTSPPTLTFLKYTGTNNEIGTMYYGSQPQAIQNAYVIPAQLSPPEQQTPEQIQQQLQEQLAYHELMQQFDNLESSLFSPSPTISSCSSSLSNSPYAESPLMALSSDFDLFPMSNPVQQHTSGFPSAPVMAPSSAVQSIYSQTNVYHQMTPPMNQMDNIEREVSSLFKHDTVNAAPLAQETLTTELSLLCKCPGKFPCGEQLPGAPIENSPYSDLSLQDIRENEYSESESGSEEEEEEQEFDHSYVPSRARSAAGPSSSTGSKPRPKSMVISTSSTAPYDSPYSKESIDSPKTPVRHDRRRSSSGSYSSFGGHSHNQLLDPELVPEIKDIHVCPVCQRRFTRPFNLRSHLMTHTTARPFPCDECHWKFTRQHDLLRHKRAKHPNSVTNTSSNAEQNKDSNSRSASAA